MSTIEHKKNTAYYLAIPMIDSTTPAAYKTGLSPTDTAYYKDGAGAWTSLAITDTFAEIGSTGVYEIDLTASEMNHDQVLIKLTASGAYDDMVLFDMRVQEVDDLNITASGNIGIDWANVENPATAVDLSATDIQLCDTITTYTGNTVQTGDGYSYLTSNLGTAGANATEAGGTGDHLTAVPWNAAWDAEVQSEVTDGLNAYDPPTRAEATSDTNSILTRLGVPSNADIAADISEVNNTANTIAADTGNISLLYKLGTSADNNGTNTTVILPAAQITADNQYIGDIIWFSDYKHTAVVTACVNSSKTLTFEPGLPNSATTAISDSVTIIPASRVLGIAGTINDLDTLNTNNQTDLDAILADTNAILIDTGTTLPATLTTIEGKVDANQVDLDTIIAAVAALNDLSSADIATALTSYDAATGSDVTTSQGVITTAISALNNISTSDVTTAILAMNTETGLTFKQCMQAVFASTAGLLSGAATTTIVMKAADQTTTRITATVDTDGNREAITFSYE